MELDSKQKKLVLKLVAEGLETDEINKRAAKCKPPFEVSRQQVDHYRKTRGIKIKEIAEEGEMAALRSGLALRNERVARLERLFDLIETDFLENNRVWIEREQALGSKEFTKFVTVMELNAAQVDLCRRLADDIAKEMNARTYERRDSLSKEDEEPSEVKITVAYEEKPKQVEE